MLKQAMVSWGSHYLLGNEEDKLNANQAGSVAANQINYSKGDSYIPPEKPKRIQTLKDFDMINKALFQKMFEKSIMHLCIRNAISLLEFNDPRQAVMPQDIEFMRNYPDDAMTATFEVLKLQRDYLYSTFHDIPKRQSKKGKGSPVKTMKGMSSR